MTRLDGSSAQILSRFVSRYSDFRRRILNHDTLSLVKTQLDGMKLFTPTGMRLSVSYRETICHTIYMSDPLREDLLVLLAVGVAIGALGVWVILAFAQ